MSCAPKPEPRTSNPEPRTMPSSNKELTLPPEWTSSTLSQFRTWLKKGVGLELSGSFPKFNDLEENVRTYLTEHYEKCPDLHFYVHGAYTIVVSSGGAKVWEVLYWDISVAVSSSCRFDGSKKCWYIHQVVVDCA